MVPFIAKLVADDVGLIQSPVVADVAEKTPAEVVAEVDLHQTLPRLGSISQSHPLTVVFLGLRHLTSRWRLQVCWDQRIVGGSRYFFRHKFRSSCWRRRCCSCSCRRRSCCCWSCSSHCLILFSSRWNRWSCSNLYKKM